MAYAYMRTKPSETIMWLTFSETTTHTGTHESVGFTDDINKASTFTYPGRRIRDMMRNGEVAPVPVEVTRTVKRI